MGECCHGRRNDRLCAECEDRPYEINAEIDRLTTERDEAIGRAERAEDMLAGVRGILLFTKTVGSPVEVAMAKSIEVAIGSVEACEGGESNG